MKRILIFDTETTGLPTTRNRPTTDTLSCFPKIVQWSWITYDISTKKYMEYDKVSLFASIEVLFSLKKSHINFPIKFSKHIED
jgi:hypothetical protein